VLLSIFSSLQLLNHLCGKKPLRVVESPAAPPTLLAALPEFLPPALA